MHKHKFTISITGSKQEATDKVKALAVLATHLSKDTLKALAHVVKTDPSKVEMAKRFLGVA